MSKLSLIKPKGITIALGENEYSLVYDFNAFAELEREFGDIQTAFDKMTALSIITKEEYKTGFYTYIDGVRDDYNEDKAWWCVYENGKSAMVGMNELKVDNGDEFEIVYAPA